MTLKLQEMHARSAELKAKIDALKGLL